MHISAYGLQDAVACRQLFQRSGRLGVSFLSSYVGRTLPITLPLCEISSDTPGQSVTKEVPVHAVPSLADGMRVHAGLSRGMGLQLQVSFARHARGPA